MSATAAEFVSAELGHEFVGLMLLKLDLFDDGAIDHKEARP